MVVVAEYWPTAELADDYEMETCAMHLGIFDEPQQQQQVSIQKKLCEGLREEKYLLLLLIAWNNNHLSVYSTMHLPSFGGPTLFACLQSQLWVFSAMDSI
jgi:hypothetical protein